VEKHIENLTQKERSDPICASHASHASKAEYPPDCYYCNETFDGIGKRRYEKHVINKHPKKPCYPGKTDIELYSLTPKGMLWEI
jgi:hypothetical protein